MTGAQSAVDLRDLQSLVVFRRPAPYWGSFFLIAFDRPQRGRRLLDHLLSQVVSAADWAAGHRDVSVSVAVTYPGLAALGVPPTSLASFPDQMRLGMAARADRLGDVGDSDPAHWHAPFGTGGVHAIVSITAATRALWRDRVAAALDAFDHAGVRLLDRGDVAAHQGMRTTFGYRDGISSPNIAGLPVSPVAAFEEPIATGEFLLGHPSETGQPLAMPRPDRLGHNGSYIGLRKIHTRVAEFRRFLQANAADPDAEEFLAAKLLGRWRSGAPLILAPHADDPELAADPSRVNRFGYADDPSGLVCPAGAHIRRVNPRDSALATLTDVRIHRILRFGAVYGEPLADGVLQDDQVDRGVYFMFLSARPNALEFLKGNWLDDGGFISLGDEQDPIAGANDGHGSYTLPAKPLRRRLRGLDRFTVTRGGEYAFLPSLTALRWLADPG